MGIITYCETCGSLISPESLENSLLCIECSHGRTRSRHPLRDSGRLPYERRPTTGEILREIRENLGNR